MKLIKTFLLLFIIMLYASDLFADKYNLPYDFMDTVNNKFPYTNHIRYVSGGSKDRATTMKTIKRYPVIMICGNRRTKEDWFGKNTGNADKKNNNVYKMFLSNGFNESELWTYSYVANENEEMKNIEELTDSLRVFIYGILFYTGATKVQILAHGEGGVLAFETIRKYNIYNLVATMVFIGSPFHSSSIYSYYKAIQGYPVHANLAPGSDFLEELLFLTETPHSDKIEYITIYSDNDEYYRNNRTSPVLKGAKNIAIDYLDHDGLRASSESFQKYYKFLNKKALKYNPKKDFDKDGFMDIKKGGNDCDDNNSKIYPGAFEIEDDNIDQDCNFRDKNSLGGKDCEILIK
ncbi:MAG: MopE-related protein [Endomicrobiaceae bacterium]|nr:MopE-related protein [Endomicrobiaceae bacterium]